MVSKAGKTKGKEIPGDTDTPEYLFSAALLE
jgi:hypothetical protein